MILLYLLILIPIAYFDLNLPLIPLEMTPAPDPHPTHAVAGGRPAVPVATRGSGAPGLCCCSGDGGPLGRATEGTRLLLLLLLDPSSGMEPLKSHYSILNSGNETDRVSPIFSLLQNFSKHLSVKYRSYIN